MSYVELASLPSVPSTSLPPAATTFANLVQDGKSTEKVPVAESEYMELVVGTPDKQSLASFVPPPAPLMSFVFHDWRITLQAEGKNQLLITTACPHPTTVRLLQLGTSVCCNFVVPSQPNVALHHKRLDMSTTILPS